MKQKAMDQIALEKRLVQKSWCFCYMWQILSKRCNSTSSLLLYGLPSMIKAQSSKSMFCLIVLLDFAKFTRSPCVPSFYGVWDQTAWILLFNPHNGHLTYGTRAYCPYASLFNSIPCMPNVLFSFIHDRNSWTSCFLQIIFNSMNIKIPSSSSEWRVPGLIFMIVWVLFW